MKIQINIETKSDSEMNHMQYLTIANTLDDVIKDIKNDPHKYLRVVDEFEKRDDDYGVVVTCVAMPGHDAFDDDETPAPVLQEYTVLKTTPMHRLEWYNVKADSKDNAIKHVQDKVNAHQLYPFETSFEEDDYFGDGADYSVEYFGDGADYSVEYSKNVIKDEDQC